MAYFENEDMIKKPFQPSDTVPTQRQTSVWTTEFTTTDHDMDSFISLDEYTGFLCTYGKDGITKHCDLASLGPTTDELGQIRKWYDHFDTNNDNLLDESEWIVSNAYYQNEDMINEPYFVYSNQEQIKRWKPEFNKVDSSGNGKIEYPEQKAYICKFGKGNFADWCKEEEEPQ